MPKRASIEFVPCSNPNSSDLRFGGEPFGIPKSFWPLSRRKGQALQFICQIPIASELFPGTSESVAYVFMNSSEDADETWSPDAGENAVVILPRAKLANSVTEGDAPRLYRMVKRMFNKNLVPDACVFSATLTFSDDPAFIPQAKLAELAESEAAKYVDTLTGNKLGGSPGFLQNDELPIAGGWHLLLQLDSTRVPFWINFGDAGIGYAFINSAGTEGKFLWQCV